MPSRDLVKHYDSLLESYAVKNSGDHQRVHPETEHPNKLPFQRDRDRILHCKAFRRLKHKTQVLVNPKDDHVRDRLTHSLEGSQIARSLCRSLQLNEDLAEAAILAHDLGHPPFGHEGEHALNEMLKPLGFSFDHNEHGYRIVTKLEHSYPDFEGLNLTKETLAAIQKHHVPWESKNAKTPHQASIEAQLVNLADEIAYYSHDVDDGLRASILNIDDLLQLELGQLAAELIRNRYGNLNVSDNIYRPQFVRSVIHLLATDLQLTTIRNIKVNNIRTLNNVYAIDKPIAAYSDQMDKATQELRSFLFKNFYQSPAVIEFTTEGKELLKELFTRLYDNPKHLPDHTQKLIDNPDPKAIVIKDYIAGMTDVYAKDTVMKLRKRLI